MKRVFVDTSGWYSYLYKEDPLHESVGAAMDAWRDRRVTTNYVLDETLTLVRARRGHGLAVRVGDALRDPGVTQLIRATAEDEDAAWRVFMQEKDKDYSFTDCVSFAVMRRLGLTTAIATDKHFRQAGFDAQPSARPVT